MEDNGSKEGVAAAAAEAMTVTRGRLLTPQRKKLEEAHGAARGVELYKERVFFAAMALKFDVVQDSRIPTAAIDGISIYYNPEWWLEQSQEHRETIYAHELLHVCLQHALRHLALAKRGGLDARAWGIAADLAINDHLEEIGFAMPTHATIPGRAWCTPYAELPRGLSTEEYYDLLTDQQSEDDAGESEDVDQGDGSEQGPEGTPDPDGSPSDRAGRDDGSSAEDARGNNGDSGGDGGAEDSEASEGETEGESGGSNAERGEGERKDGQGDGGSEGDDAAMEGKGSGSGSGSGDDTGRFDGFEDSGGMGGYLLREGADASEERRKLEVAIRAATEMAARVGGEDPKSCAMIGGETAARVNWRDELAEYLRARCRDDYSFARPNNRMASADFVLPGMHGQSLGEIVIAVDSSGSIDVEALQAFAAEVQDLVSAYDCTVHLLYHHSVLYRVEEWSPSDGDIELNADQTGGTSHLDVFEWIEENVEDPSVVICLTDLFSEFPDSEPDYPVLFAHNCRRFRPGRNPWPGSAKVIGIDD